MQSHHKKSFAAEQLRQRQRKSPATIAIIVFAVAIAVAAVGYALYIRFGTKETPVTEPVAPPIKSIAVLPFRDLSPEKDQEWFCDGMSEEIINKLTPLEGLRVIASTSTFYFKGKDVKIEDIGKELDVEYVLEGSVRKVGNDLRVTAQLVTVEDQSHLFSKNYDRKLENVFAIQDEISLSIIEELKGTLFDSDKAILEKRYTNDLEAYELFLKGRDKGGLEGIYFLEQAIRRDPNFALAYAEIAQKYNRMAYATPSETNWSRAREAVQKALELDNTLAEAYTQKAWIHMYADRNWLSAEQLLNHAISLNPGYFEAYRYYRDYYMIMGNWDKAIQMVERAYELDPIETEIFLIRTYAIAGRDKKAWNAFHQLVDKEKDRERWYWYKWDIPFFLGQYKQAIEAIHEYQVQFEKYLEGTSKYIILGRLGYAEAITGNRDSAEQILSQYINEAKEPVSYCTNIALIYSALGNNDEAYRWLKKAIERNEAQVLFLKSFRRFEPFRSDPRYHDLLKELNLEAL